MRRDRLNDFLCAMVAAVATMAAVPLGRVEALPFRPLRWHVCVVTPHADHFNVPEILGAVRGWGMPFEVIVVYFNGTAGVRDPANEPLRFYDERDPSAPRCSVWLETGSFGYEDPVTSDYISSPFTTAEMDELAAMQRAFGVRRVTFSSDVNTSDGLATVASGELVKAFSVAPAAAEYMTDMRTDWHYCANLAVAWFQMVHITDTSKATPFFYVEHSSSMCGLADMGAAGRVSAAIIARDGGLVEHLQLYFGVTMSSAAPASPVVNAVLDWATYGGACVRGG